jgi:exoribonuclease R
VNLTLLSLLPPSCIVSQELSEREDLTALTSFAIDDEVTADPDDAIRWVGGCACTDLCVQI